MDPLPPSARTRSDAEALTTPVDERAADKNGGAGSALVEKSARPRRSRRRHGAAGKAVGGFRIQPREPGSATGKKGRWWELPVLAIVAVAVAVVVKTFIVQPFYIPSGSMEHTLNGCTGCSGDKILVNKPIFDFRSPHPGDIVVFSRPDAWPPDPDTPAAPKTNVVTGPLRWFGQLVGVIPPDREDLVKRVVAVGGQTVKCCDARSRVQVSTNGPDGPFRALNEPYVDFINVDGTTGTEIAFGPVTVPHGRLWVMGDRRVDSADSRWHCVAGASAPPSAGQLCDPVSSTVPISHVIGKAFVIAWPPSRWRSLGTPPTFKTDALAAADGSGGGLPALAALLAAAPLWRWRRRRTQTRARAEPGSEATNTPTHNPPNRPEE